MFLTRSGPRIDREFKSLIFDDDYSYFLGYFEESWQMELVKLAFHTQQASTILAFTVAGQGEVLFPDHLQKERERLMERVDNLIVERDNYLKEV